LGVNSFPLKETGNTVESPILRSAADATDADKLPELLAIARQRARSADEAKVLADALHRHEPWLEWSGKREKPWFEVEPVALHMHERISTQAILRVLAREDVERDLFADPQHDYAKAVQFYQQSERGIRCHLRFRSVVLADAGCTHSERVALARHAPALPVRLRRRLSLSDVDVAACCDAVDFGFEVTQRYRTVLHL
jgi:hypothetical protein